MARGRSRRSTTDYGEFWPGYVDALSTLLLVVMFLMSIFMLAQYFATQEATGKDTVLERLNRQLAELTNILALERSKAKNAEDQLTALQATLASLREENARISGFALSGDAAARSASERIAALEGRLSEEQGKSSQALAQVELLNQQILALRQQIAALNDALDASEKKDAASQMRIDDLGRRLNAALARQVQELKRYRSDFFGRLRELLASRKDIQVVGDRFIFQSEVLFSSGEAELSTAGLAAIDQLATAINELRSEIPDEIDWVLQVDGHTDANPINTPEFPSNWELSAARALSVVKYLIARGVPAKRLVAAGYGEFTPIARGSDAESLRRNRRIELKLTNR